MDNIKEAMDFIEKNLKELPDSTGIYRCVLFADTFRIFKSLCEQIEHNEEQYKEEKLKMEARIADLEGEIHMLRDNQTERNRDNDHD